MPSILLMSQMNLLACMASITSRALAAYSAQDDAEDITFLQVQARSKQPQGDSERAAMPVFLDSGPMSPTDTYKLNDGYEMPILGLGCGLMQPGNETYTSVSAALKLGYRMFDTAELYANEADVGRAVRDSGIPRSQNFITTKLSYVHEYDAAVQALLQSNVTLGLGYIDLILIHVPDGGNIVEAWDALVHMRDIGVARSIGVSNFQQSDLEELLTAGRATPAVNQIELHPLVWKSQTPVVKYCRYAGILVQAYGSVLQGHDDLVSLASGIAWKSGLSLNFSMICLSILVQAYGSVLQGHDALVSLASGIASKYNKTVYAVMLRWALDKNFQVIPKSTHVEYLAENLGVFDFTLTTADTKALEDLPQIPQGYVYAGLTGEP